MNDGIKCCGRLFVHYCKICGNPIPRYDMGEVFPICDDCIANLREIIMAKRGRENAEDIAQERLEMGITNKTFRR